MGRLLTPAAVADVLAVSSRTVRRMLDAGELPGLRVGKLWRVDPDRLAEWQRAREMSGNCTRRSSRRLANVWRVEWTGSGFAPACLHSTRSRLRYDDGL